jgi:hypothetical protein
MNSLAELIFSGFKERLYMEIRLVIGFNEIPEFVSARKDYAVTVLYTSNVTLGHDPPLQSVTEFSIPYFTVTSTADLPLSLISRTVAGASYQLLTAIAHG